MSTIANEKGLRGVLNWVAADLFPGNFAFVMATGIIAAGFNAYGWHVVAKTLLVIAGMAYLYLWFLTIIRCVKYPRRLIEDLSSASKAPAFFTTVAATGVLGASQLRVFGSQELSFALYWLAVILWIGFFYGMVAEVIVSKNKAPLLKGINGAWLTLVVATQSVSILGSLLAAKSTSPALMIFISGAVFALGCACYAVIIGLLIVRLVFMPLDPEDLSPPYWIMMGAAAISCLAGTEFDKASASWNLRVNTPFLIQAITVGIWVIATAWLPLLIVLGIWRHTAGRVALAFHPQYWSLVFPLGMYAFATHSMGLQFKIPFVEPLALAFMGFAAFAWITTLIGLSRKTVRTLSARYDTDHSEASKTVPRLAGGN